MNKTEWKKNRVHEITLPSGAEISIQVPNLSALSKSGKLPNGLVEIAIGAAAGESPEASPDLLEKQAELEAFIVAETVVKPAISVEDVEELPYEDVEMIVSIAMRDRDLDAVGKHIGGLDKVADFRRFRGLDDS